MKRIWTKFPFILIACSTFMTVWKLIDVALYSLLPNLLNDGTSVYDPELSAWLSWISVLLFSSFSIIFYLMDAVISVIKAIKNIDRAFNIFLAIMIVIGIAPVVLVLGSALRLYKMVIWLSYYFILFALEIISLVRYIRQRPKKVTDYETEI